MTGPQRAPAFTLPLAAQDAPGEAAPTAVEERARLVAAAREIMPEDDMTVWFATNTRSRKVREMRPRP